MTDYQQFYYTGAIINSAVYILVVALAGIIGGDHAVIVLAASTAGVAFLSYCAQLLRPSSQAALALSIVSNVLSIGAGVVLVWDYLR